MCLLRPQAWLALYNACLQLASVAAGRAAGRADGSSGPTRRAGGEWQALLARCSEGMAAWEARAGAPGCGHGGMLMRLPQGLPCA